MYYLCFCWSTDTKNVKNYSTNKQNDLTKISRALAEYLMLISFILRVLSLLSSDIQVRFPILSWTFALLLEAGNNLSYRWKAVLREYRAASKSTSLTFFFQWRVLNLTYMLRFSVMHFSRERLLLLNERTHRIHPVPLHDWFQFLQKKWILWQSGHSVTDGRWYRYYITTLIISSVTIKC